MLAPRPTKLRSQRDINLWWIPLQLSLVAVALFGITLIPDILDKYGVIHIPSWLTMGSIDDARAILSAMMGAVATVLALIFSVALLVLSMVSTLFGPRLLYRFLQDWVTQITIGMFMGTFVYICLVFLVTHQDPGSSFIPQISLITAWILVVLSFGFLVYYSHRTGHTLPSKPCPARSSFQRLGIGEVRLQGQSFPVGQLQAVGLGAAEKFGPASRRKTNTPSATFPLRYQALFKESSLSRVSRVPHRQLTVCHTTIWHILTLRIGGKTERMRNPSPNQEITYKQLSTYGTTVFPPLARAPSRDQALQTRQASTQYKPIGKFVRGCNLLHRRHRPLSLCAGESSHEPSRPLSRTTKRLRSPKVATGTRQR